MRKILLTLTIVCFYLTGLIAQVPNLPTKGALSETILSSRTFSNSTQVDTVLRPKALPSSYTLEVVGKVTSATGRGLDIEGRNSSAKGFRLSLDASNLKESSSLSSIQPLSLSRAGEDHTVRIAVRNDSAHIYQNGAFIQSQSLKGIQDIIGGVEGPIQDAVAGPNLVPNWAGTTGNYAGKPSDYGWSYTGTTSNNLFNIANSGSGSRYMDVNSTSNTHTYNGTTYNGRVLYIRWDANNIANAVYVLPVTLEANTTYDFSMLHAYVSNSTGAKTITVGVGKTNTASGRYATKVFNAVGTRDLKRESFVFTSQEAGTYYLTFTGPWGLFSIAELSLNKNLPGSYIANWAGIAPNTAGKPSDYSWSYTGTTSTTLFAVANSTTVGTSRYLDVNASSGSNLHTYNGSTYVGRVFYIRWDNSSLSTVAYNYPVMLDANTAYDFSMLHAYVANATGAKTVTVGIGKTTAAADRFDSHIFTTSGTRDLKKEDFIFTSKEAGLYYITVTGDWGIFSISQLSLNKILAKPRFVFGKNYPSGAVNMTITSVTYEEGAYAPTGVIAAAKQNLTITGAMASYLPTVNTNFIVSGKTDLHLTGEYSPLINSTVELNSNDSWLFFDNINPSVVIANWLDDIKISGAVAVNNTNVRVAIYKNGTVVIPNGNQTSSQALQVFTQANLAGTSQPYAIDVYNNSLGAFDNSIKSFKLKRGYMATLANNPDGSGYSRVFIANDDDLIVNTMPTGLDGTVSFIRVFRWDWISKKGKAGWSPAKINATWYYDWNIGGGASSTYDYAIIRQNGGWPSWTDIKNKTNVNHLLGFNEPDRPDQSNMTVDQAIAQWPEMMKSGLRIGSPAPATPENAWITDFMTKCNQLNYRVDFVAIHCYWGGLTPQQWYSKLKSIYDRVKRPLWITEWNNGANWTTETWPADQEGQFQKQLSDIKGILGVLDTASFVERYAIYDWVENKRAMVLADTLTPAGKYYAANKSNFAFNPSKAYIHNWALLSPTASFTINSDDYSKITLQWSDVNVELGSKYVLERMIDGVDASFIAVQEFTAYTRGGTLTYVDNVYNKATYRIKAYNLDGTQFAYSLTNTIVTKDATPVAPTSVTGTALSASINKITWNAGANARSYNLKRGTSSSGPFATILARTTLLEYQDENLTPSTNYYYVVTSLNSAGESANSTVLLLRTKDLVAPAAVQNPHIASGDTKIALTWDFIYDAKYEISRSATQTGTYSVIATDVDAVRYEDINRVNGTTYYYKIVAYNAAGRSPETSVLAGTPVLGQQLYISFDESTGTFAQDLWGGYNGTLGSTVIHNTGYKAGSVQLDGTSTSYVNLADSPVKSLTDFTISTWVKMDALSNWMRIFDFGTGTANYMFLTPQSSVSGGVSNVRYSIKTGGVEQTVNYAYTFPLNTWTHFAITQSGDTARLYVNGTLAASNNALTFKPANLGITNQNYVGKSQYNDPLLKGSVDEFKIYNYALNAQNISNLANDLPLSAEMAVNKNEGLNLIAAVAEAAVIQVYPNPATSYIYISGLDSKVCDYGLFDLLGKQIARGIVKDSKISLPDYLINGVYVLQLKNAGEVLLKKQIIINK